VARYHAEDDQYDARNLELIADFRRALHFDDLVLHYQPKLNINDRSVDVVEALVRWQHPVHGLLYPDSFIPLIEPTDLVEPLTEWVIERAVAELNRLDDDSIAVAVNVSARNLGDAAFARRVLDRLDVLRVPAQRLIIEITETALLSDPDRAADILAELHAAGVRVSLDDFGQGQTSLGYLSALQLDELKIDRAFVRDMLENPAHAAIVRSIVDLGHNLGLQVVSEGVETDDVLAAVAATGCDIAQGYLFARPMPIGDLSAWLADRRVPSTPT
jgi:EAL domain-containing protein (putative c-di-GMP-specific phosphodiesterase class I)